MILMIAPAPNMALGAAPSGAAYVSDGYGLVRIVNDSAADQGALTTAGCFTLSPFGGWGNFGFDTLADLYAADTGAIFTGITGYPRWTVATVFADGTAANNGTWCKTGTGAGSGAWVQVSTATLFSISSTAAASAAAAQASAGVALAAAQASGSGVIYGTYANANAAVGSLSNGQIVQVLADETRSGDRTIYQVTGGALVFKVDLSPAGMTSGQLTALFNAMNAAGLFAQFQGT